MASASGPACGKHPGYRVGCYCGNEASIDCRTMPGKKICDPSSHIFAYCVAAGKECDQMTLDTCEGTSLVHCVDGSKVRTDCTSLGFGGCAVVQSGALSLGICQ